MVSRHIIRNYLFHKKPNCSQSELKASELEINWKNTDFCELIKNAYQKIDSTNEKLELAKIEDKVDLYVGKMSNFVTMDDVRIFVNHKTEKLSNELENCKTEILLLKSKIVTKLPKLPLAKTSSRKNSESEEEANDDLRIDTDQSDEDIDEQNTTHEGDNAIID